MISFKHALSFSNDCDCALEKPNSFIRKFKSLSLTLSACLLLVLLILFGNTGLASLNNDSLLFNNLFFENDIPSTYLKYHYYTITIIIISITNL